MEDSIEHYIRILKNTDEKLKKSGVQISEQEIVTAQRKKLCQDYALKVVNFSIDGSMPVESFLLILKCLNPEYYQDIVDERAVSRLCGYCLCKKNIPDMPRQQYFISAKAKKVYEITERKKFCSNYCYSASVHVKDQLDTTPLWLRKGTENYNYKLLPTTESGQPGELIDQGIARSPNHDQASTFTSISQFTEVSLEEVGEIETQSIKNRRKNAVYETTNKETVKVTRNGRCGKKKSEMETIEETKEDIKTNDDVIEVVEKSESSSSEAIVDTTNIGSEIKSNKGGKEIHVVKLAKEFKQLKSLESKSDVTAQEISRQSTLKMANKGNLVSPVKSPPESNVKSNLKAPITTELKQLKLKDENLLEEYRKIEHHLTQEERDKLMTLLATKKGQFKIVLNALIKKHSSRKPKTKLIEALPIKKTKPLEVIEEVNDVKEIGVVDQPEVMDPLLIQIKDCLTNWVTIDTVKFIHGSEKILDIARRHGKDESTEIEKLCEHEIFNETNKIDEKQLSSIMQFLTLQELEEENIDQKLIDNRVLLPVPNYEQLKEASKAMELKIKAFYSPSTEVKTPKKKQNSKDEEEEDDIVLPLVDAHSRKALRIRVFFNSINCTLKKHIKVFNLGSNVYTDIHELVKTFNLSSNNVMFKPIQWSVICLVLIEILSIKYVEVKDRLNLVWDTNKKRFTRKLSRAEQFFLEARNLLEEPYNVVDCWYKNYLQTNIK